METKHVFELKKNASKLLLCLLFIMNLSCTNNENSNDTETVISKDQINTVLAEMKAIGDQQGKVVTFNLENIIKKDYQNHFQLTTIKAYKFANGINNLQAAKTNKEYNYVVTCSYSDGKTKVTKCGNNVGCAGAATWDCLDNGGCATICDAKPTIAYIPSFNEKVIELSYKIEALLTKSINHLSKNNNILAFSVAVNKDKSDIQINKFINIESSSQKSSITAKSANKQYRVTCTKNYGVMMDNVYNTKQAASEAILFCTDELGGCAEICDVVVLAAPLPELKKITLERITKEILPAVL